MEPRFLTAWEREDYEREKRGEKPLGPLGGNSMTITALDLAWEQINALGGAATNPTEEAMNETVGKALDIIEALGGSDPAPKRR